jgi:hypothetical protein
MTPFALSFLIIFHSGIVRKLKKTHLRLGMRQCEMQKETPARYPLGKEKVTLYQPPTTTKFTWSTHKMSKRCRIGSVSSTFSAKVQDES